MRKATMIPPEIRIDPNGMFSLRITCLLLSVGKEEGHQLDQIFPFTVLFLTKSVASYELICAYNNKLIFCS